MKVSGYTIEPGANLAGANLDRANLRGANLRGANLDGANLFRAVWDGLRIDGLPSGQVTLYPDGRLAVGCWVGTPDTLETLIAGTDWPEAEGPEQELRRPGLQAVVELCRAHLKMNNERI